MKAEEAQKRALLAQILPNTAAPSILPLHKPSGTGTSTPVLASSQSDTMRGRSDGSRSASNIYNLPAGYTPFLDHVDRDMQSNHLTPMRLPSMLTTEDFTRAVAVATVSALRHQGSIVDSQSASAQKPRNLPVAVNHPMVVIQEQEQVTGGHEAPSWTRGFSAGVLLGCTLLYAFIAGMQNGFHFDG